MSKEIVKVILNLEKKTFGKTNLNYKRKYYKRNDFDENHVKDLKKNFKKKLKYYLKNKNKLINKYPIKYKKI